jgi:ribosomal protein L19
MSYFTENLNNVLCSEKKTFIKGFSRLLQPFVGDVLKIFLSKKGSYFFFEGVSFSISKRRFVSIDSTIRLIYRSHGIFITITFILFANLIFAYEKVDFKRSKFQVRRAKLNKFKSILL